MTLPTLLVEVVPGMKLTCLIAASLMLAALVGCRGSSPTAPSSITLTTIRYQRAYAVVGDDGHKMTISVSLPATKQIPFCLPTQVDSSTFVCSNLNWTLDAGEEASIFIYDPAVERQVATTLFVNGYQVKRVTAGSNGIEVGSFHLTASGGIE